MIFNNTLILHLDPFLEVFSRTRHVKFRDIKTQQPLLISGLNEKNQVLPEVLTSSLKKNSTAQKVKTHVASVPILRRWNFNFTLSRKTRIFFLGGGGNFIFLLYKKSK